MHSLGEGLFPGIDCGVRHAMIVEQGHGSELDG